MYAHGSCLSGAPTPCLLRVPQAKCPRSYSRHAASSYDDFVGASVDEACRVARRLGEPCERGSDAYAALEAHQLEYPRNKFGAHKYSLSDYGLSEVEVRRDMEWYTLWWQQERAKQT